MPRHCWREYQRFGNRELPPVFYIKCQRCALQSRVPYLATGYTHKTTNIKKKLTYVWAFKLLLYMLIVGCATRHWCVVISLKNM